jgi:hypothetical protein
MGYPLSKGASLSDPLASQYGLTCLVSYDEMKGMAMHILYHPNHHTFEEGKGQMARGQNVISKIGCKLRALPKQTY